MEGMLLSEPRIKTESEYDFPQIQPEPLVGDTHTPKSKKIKKEKQEKITDHMPIKKKRDRFNGMPEDEVAKRLLPDHLAEDLDIVIVGINPGLMAAYVGHHYAGPGNHFWKCMFLSGLIPEPLNAYDDFKLLQYGIGFTNIVARTTRGSADLTKKEIKEGAELLKEKLRKFKPKIAVFNGKGIYEVFLGHKNFAFGKQPDFLEGTETLVYVMPSSSARCSQLPRAVDKVPFYAALKKLRDYVRGTIIELDDSEVCFPDVELKVVKREVKTEISNGECQGSSTDFQAGAPAPSPKKRKRVKKESQSKTQDFSNMGNSTDSINHLGEPVSSSSDSFLSQTAMIAASAASQAISQSMMQMFGGVGNFATQGYQTSMFASQQSQNNHHSMFMTGQMAFTTPGATLPLPMLSQVPLNNIRQFETFPDFPSIQSSLSVTPQSSTQGSALQQGWASEMCSAPPPNGVSNNYAMSSNLGYDHMNNPVTIKQEPASSSNLGYDHFNNPIVIKQEPM